MPISVSTATPGQISNVEVAKPKQSVVPGIATLYYQVPTAPGAVATWSTVNPDSQFGDQEGSGQPVGTTKNNGIANKIASKIANKMAGFNAQKQNIYGTSRESAQTAASARHSNILDFIQQLESGQRALNERGVQNELAKKQGATSIMDMVSRGIRQGGVLLAGRNATDSSAAEGIARAYGDMGRRQLGKIGNQYEIENRNIGIAQDEFNTNRATGLRKFDEDKTITINNIVTQARNALAALDAAMLEADLPTRIQIEQEKEAIKAEALQILGQFDQELARANTIAPSSVDERRRTAAELATAGVASANPYEFSTQAPAQFQNTGPFASELPLFTFRPPRRQEV